MKPSFESSRPSSRASSLFANHFASTSRSDTPPPLPTERPPVPRSTSGIARLFGPSTAAEVARKSEDQIRSQSRTALLPPAQARTRPLSVWSADTTPLWQRLFARRPSHAPTDDRAIAVTVVTVPESPRTNRRRVVTPWEVEKPAKTVEPGPHQARSSRFGCFGALLKRRGKSSDSKASKWTIILRIVLLILGLLAAANLILLDARVLAPTMAASDHARACATLFDLTASTSPLAYPCSTCIVPLSASPSLSPNALQFCALRSIFDAVALNSTSNALVAAGWFRDASFCTWGAIGCANGTSNVISLTLSPPAVPSSIPTTITLLTFLTTLSITGNGDLPDGSVPALPSSLRSLTLQSSGLCGGFANIATLPDGLTTFRLINNSAMSAPFSSRLLTLSLQTLVLSSQGLVGGAFLPAIAASATLSKSLTALDLSDNALTGPLPSFATFTSLKLLHLGGNNLTGAVTGLPTSLTTLGLGNTQLSGALPALICLSPTLTTCVVRGSSLSSCGVCA